MSISMNARIQRDNDENFGLDPITYALMTDPVIDQGGHTFDRTTISALVARTPRGTPLRCPIGREVINVDRLVSNRLGHEAIDRVSREANTQSELRQTSEELKNRNVELIVSNNELVKINALEKKESSQEIARQSKNIDELKATVDKLLLENRELKIHNQELTPQNRSTNLNNQQLTRENSPYSSRISELKKEINDTRKKTQNISEMTFVDQLLIAYGPFIGKNNHMWTVMNRGIDE